MKIIEYNPKYDEQIKILLVELQSYITKIDKDKYNIITKEFKEKYFQKTIEEVQNYEGKIFLAQNNKKIVGLIVGLINNEEVYTYDFKAPKRGRITELIVTHEYQKNKIGEKLLNKMEEYFKSVECKAVLIDVFGYNLNAQNFYSKNGYKNRNIEIMEKNLEIE